MKVNMVVLAVAIAVAVVGSMGGLGVLTALGVFSAFPLFFGMILSTGNGSKGFGGGDVSGKTNQIGRLIGSGTIEALVRFNDPRVKITLPSIEFNGQTYDLATISAYNGLKGLHGLHTEKAKGSGSMAGKVGRNYLLVTSTGAVALSQTMLVYFVRYFAERIPSDSWKAVRQIALDVSTATLGGVNSHGATVQGELSTIVTQPVPVETIAEIGESKPDVDQEYAKQKFAESLEKAKEDLVEPILTKAQRKALRRQGQ